MRRHKVKSVKYGDEVYNTSTGEVGKVVWIGYLVASNKSPIAIEVADRVGALQMWMSYQVELL